MRILFIFFFLCLGQLSVASETSCAQSLSCYMATSFEEGKLKLSKLIIDYEKSKIYMGGVSYPIRKWDCEGLYCIDSFPLYLYVPKNYKALSNWESNDVVFNRLDGFHIDLFGEEADVSIIIPFFGEKSENVASNPILFYFSDKTGLVGIHIFYDDGYPLMFWKLKG